MQLFVIESNDNYIYTIYTELEKAKIKLKKIHDTTPDYKSYEYQIRVYELVDGEFQKTKTYYTYTFNYEYELHTDRF